MNHKFIFREIADFLKTMVFFLSIIILFRMFVFANFEVSGESMANNFHDGEKLIVSKLDYKFIKPERFDVIIFKANEKQDFIKRVIGLPGEKVEYKNNLLYINDQPIEESYLEQNTYDFKLGDILQYDKVPKNHVFVLGDNRTNSLDSRSKEVGFVSYDQIIGKVKMRYLPFNRFDLGVSGNQLLN